MGGTLCSISSSRDKVGEISIQKLANFFSLNIIFSEVAVDFVVSVAVSVVLACIS